MTMLMILLAALLYALLVGSLSVSPRRSQLSTFELRRREKNAPTDIETLRHEYYSEVTGILRVVRLMFAIVFALVAVAWLGWFLGVTLAIIGICCSSVAVRLKFVRGAIRRLYDRYEGALLQFVSRYRQAVRLFRSVEPTEREEYIFHSRQEFLYAVEKTVGVLTKDERRMVRKSLEFAKTNVAALMTPRSEIVSVEKDDVVGPLLLDELHKSGHSQFPVIDESVDRVEGVLDIRNLLQLQDKKTYKASSLMLATGERIHQHQTLEEALSLFVHARCQLLIVTNDRQETVGLVTLSDVAKAVLGRKVAQ